MIYFISCIGQSFYFSFIYSPICPSAEPTPLQPPPLPSSPSPSNLHVADGHDDDDADDADGDASNPSNRSPSDQSNQLRSSHEEVFCEGCRAVENGSVHVVNSAILPEEGGENLHVGCCPGGADSLLYQGAESKVMRRASRVIM